jgi:FkbM family methyltransferase
MLGNSKNIKVVKGLAYLSLRYLLKRKFLLARSNFLKASFKCSTSDVLGRHLYKYGIHEPDNSVYLKENIYLNSGDIAIDIGANLGWYSVLLSKVSHAKAKIYSFEPDPFNYNLLDFNLQGNDCANVNPVNMGVSNEPGNLDLYLYPSKNRGRHSLIPNDDHQKVSVDVVCLNKYFNDTNLEQLKFIKIDIEGFEYFAIKGATDLLEIVPTIMMEYSPQLYKLSFNAKKLVDCMVGYSYIPKILVDGELTVIKTDDLLNLDYQMDIFWIKV